MLRLVHVSNAIPFSWPVDQSAEFEAGMAMGLTVQNNMVVATVSNGLSFIGIADDYKVKAFTANAWDETLVTPAVGVPGRNGMLVTPVDIKVELQNPNVLPSSFISIPVDIQLIPRNGVVVFPAGTELNYDLLGTGIPNAIKTNVRYQFQIPNIVGDDTTAASGRVTVWINRMLGLTDKFETNQVYPLNANLFVNEYGMFTTRQITCNHPAFAVVTAPPSAISPYLEFMLL
jgi:hypothetical protein